MEQVQIGDILITGDRLAELDEGHTVASVSREDFRAAAGERGFELRRR